MTNSFKVLDLGTIGRRLLCGMMILVSTTAAQAQSSGAAKVPEDRWQFQTHDYDLGTLCMAGVKHGDVTLGFIAMKRKVEYRCFVNDLIDSATRATWRIDDNQPTVIDGKPQRDNRWVTEFLREEFIADFQQGSQLAVTSANGDRVVVSLTNAKDAVVVGR